MAGWGTDRFGRKGLVWQGQVGKGLAGSVRLGSFWHGS